ncbi:hypothetical protein WSS_A38201 [Rhodococcus opacus M213]|uniref:Integral membrane bound transporter domain-containing protein n=1 Tax=Rhodococcus opacus M213 TaxID=1129896 RepID=K8X904_RHOOP|nr:FUSC family protein [Rhodococcus opacus]EKT77316.1 hypothetical protein WSS_A38201 [Rhodococcus opacus M213]
MVILSAGNPMVVAIATVMAAAIGVVVTSVGVTAALAVVLIAVHTQRGAGAGFSLLGPYAGGVITVFAATMLWFGAELVRGRRPRPSTATAASTERRPRRDFRTASPQVLRISVAVVLAMLGTELMPEGMVGGHWLITSVLLSIQPYPAATKIRLAQRLSGNTIGAVFVAAFLAPHPVQPIVVMAMIALLLLAVALRPVNYFWWALTGPPVLLLISEYPDLYPWYEGGVRLAMNVLGAAIVLVVVLVPPRVADRVRRRNPHQG